MTTDRRGSLRLLRIAGIELFVHWSWLIIALLLTLGFQVQLTESNPGLGDIGAWGLALLGSAVFFASVLTHELAHALMSRRRGIEVKGITLFLFGGATEADASSRSARDELIIAIVGPLTSVGLAALLAVLAQSIGPERSAVSGLLGYLALVNLLLALFNMTPGLPLDGGRVFRAIVWAITDDFQKATRWAASGGVATGYALIGIGIVVVWTGSLGGFWYAAIGWVIAQSARSMAAREQIRETFERLRASDVMTPGVVTIPATATVADAVATYFALQNHTAFPVVDDQRFVGMITLAAAKDLSEAERASTTAGQLARPPQPELICGPTTPMLDVIDALAVSPGSGRAIVMDDDELVGIISPSDVIRRRSLDGLLAEVR